MQITCTINLVFNLRKDLITPIYHVMQPTLITSAPCNQLISVQFKGIDVVRCHRALIFGTRSALNNQHSVPSSDVVAKILIISCNKFNVGNPH
jgi:hypothetical protein